MGPEPPPANEANSAKKIQVKNFFDMRQGDDRLQSNSKMMTNVAMVSPILVEYLR